PLPVGQGARERSSAMAEELALPDVERDRGAVDPHQRTPRPLAQTVDQSGDELLTRARFPEEKDRRVARGGRPDLLHDLGPRGARADRQPLLAWITLFALQVVDLPPEGPRL